jgi:phage baseplate assembly protein W
MARYININFPFRDSPEGHFLDLTRTDSKAIRSDLMHLLLTQKGQRYYMPDFGTNLLKYIFDQNDNTTHGELKEDIDSTVRKYIPNLTINEVNVRQSESNQLTATVEISYTITEGVFEETDILIINL